MTDAIAGLASLWRSPAHVETRWLGGKSIVLGILNVTPDSFSDGGRFLDLEPALAHGIRMTDEGADLVDVGGESTRPGARRVPEADELRRVIPVIRELAESGVPVSIDTTRARVAEAALVAGAAWVNDVSGGLADPDMASVVAGADVPYVATHWRGHSDIMTTRSQYRDVVEDVRRELGRRLETLIDAGVRESQIILDPGLGFAKRADHDWALLRGIGRLHSLGRPLLIGASRKSFLQNAVEHPAYLHDSKAMRDALTVATTALAVSAGAAAVRVHDVRANAAAVAAAQKFGA